MSDKEPDKSNSQFIDYCDEKAKVMRDRAKYIYKMAEDERETKIKGLLHINASTHDNLGALFDICGINIRSIERLNNAIENLPDREEFNQIKVDAKKDRQEHREAVIGFKKALEEQKERDEHGANIYG